MITIENKGNQIMLFGRDGYDSYIHKKEFNPYFYVEDDGGEYISIEGKRLKKINVDKLENFYEERKKYDDVYEGDVRYVNRFIIDIIKEYRKENIRKCYIDIETMRTKKGYESCEVANNPINCIGCYDNFTKKYEQFILGVTHKEEKDMLKDFIRYIIKNDFDMFIAWNGEGFDFPFLVNRIKKLGLQKNNLCRFNEKCKVRRVMYGKYNVHIFGRVCFDLMEAYKRISQGGRESWSLDYISNYEGVGEKEKYKGELDDLYFEDIQKFIEYNKKDVELMVLLDEKLKIVDFFDELRRLCYCRFQDVFMNTKMADCLCLKYARENGFVLPNAGSNEGKKISGGYVKENIPDLYDNVAVMDMKSLYPSVMIAFNTSYETLLSEKKDGCINMFDNYYFRKEKGVIPAIVKPLLDKRKEMTKKRNDIYEEKGADSREYKSLDITQYALKEVANSFYGVLLEPHFRLNKRDVGQSITFASQTIIRHVIEWFENKGFNVIYCDTDSVFVEMKDNSIDDMKNYNREINEYFHEYFKQFNINENIFKLEFEKVYKKVLFKKNSGGKGVKKRYAGRVIWQDGRVVDKMNVMGFESRRSDSPQIGRDFLKEVLRMICYGYEKNEIEQYINEFKNRIKFEFNAEQIAIPIGISKPLNQYDNQIHARASRLANQKHDAQIKQGDKIKYLYVLHNDNVIAFKSDKYMWAGYKIDYERMMKRIVDMKVGPLFESLNWNHNFNMKNTKRKTKEIKFEDTLKQIGLW